MNHLNAFKNLQVEVDFLRDTYQIVKDKRGLLFLVDLEKDLIKGSLVRGEWEGHLQNLMHPYLRSGSVVLDIGAHIGTSAIDCAKHVGCEGSVIAFEPNPKIYQELLQNIRLNHIQNIIALPIAIGAKQELGNMYTPHENNEGNSLFCPSRHGAISSIPLDLLELTNISLIKIDVEGYEKKVISGAINTILRERPVIFIEIWEEHREEILRFFSNINYIVIYVLGADFIALPI